ncbi:NADH dehydrogenase (ubiquinone) complex I, assembly factor 6 isoform X1 [Chelonus insularis]|uniref:NADH dehydrogenase (ubiquinone) complex I, assembly factor 6 isoform X1 n=1 Tax=Chelonus insularis TaxID=460826 RepID=UPI00158B11F5|nr:NADH dehydrogenase (ubiquinone) complex I, assembly factor 6 isoform X1 [Chelonus insularis]XP_034951302.1 NADH dehydrogenase (ubiquinone) complex I, assembly factor 6 isoform X1 [Chelonus insularis]XP_034951303.1 NADH dehydrogenase (ubiquinone) complex I, assembly factor 6 isoform X1 [Chelonus insularis]
MNKFKLIFKNSHSRLLNTVSTIKKQNPSQYCLQLVRKNDYENYLCSLLLPKDIRLTAIAIRAFNVEIALVQDHTREPTIANMRYAFWNDTLSKIYDNNPPEAPVPLELNRILRIHKLSKRYFQRLLDARWKQSKSDLFLDLSAIEQYAEETVSPIYYLLLESKNIKDIHVDHMASHLGKAQGIITLIRSIPYHAQKRIMVLPQDILLRHSVSSESVFRGESSKALNEVIFEVASRANQHLEKADSIRKNIKHNLSHIFLPAVNIAKYLKRLQHSDFNVFDSKLYKKQNMLPFHLYYAKWFSPWSL